ncbi:unnamed protein product [Prorocentrum cordatum]|uniref:Uncharacterized protein n=1 Tax=Prorocentrum cordatum TaxID=2364126 RepID=A0ABN9Y5G6_9DINO|nr:unnamed protein product [Polarella glacialis]
MAEELKASVAASAAAIEEAEGGARGGARWFRPGAHGEQVCGLAAQGRGKARDTERGAWRRKLDTSGALKGVELTSEALVSEVTEPKAMARAPRAELGHSRMATGQLEDGAARALAAASAAVGGPPPRARLRRCPGARAFLQRSAREASPAAAAQAASLSGPSTPASPHGTRQGCWGVEGPAAEIGHRRALPHPPLRRGVAGGQVRRFGHLSEARLLHSTCSRSS